MGNIARVHAEAGDVARALSMASSIPDDEKRAEALAGIARAPGHRREP